jgi:hypothetical protein
MRDHPAQRYQREFDAIMRQTEERAALATHSSEIAIRKASCRGGPVVDGGCSFRALSAKPEKPISTVGERPKPEDFGLKIEQIQSQGRLPRVIERGMVASGFVAMILVGVAMFSWDWTLALFPLFSLFALYVVAIGIAFCLDKIRPRDPQVTESYRKYIEAVAAHNAILALYHQELKDWEEALKQWERTQIAFWRGLSGRTFERELANLFRLWGHGVQLTPPTNDGGVDLFLRDEGQTILVQCKAYKGSVGPAAVRELYGAFKHLGGSQAWLVTTGRFTAGARRFAQNKQILLLTIQDLLTRGPW